MSEMKTTSLFKLFKMLFAYPLMGATIATGVCGDILAACLLGATTGIWMIVFGKEMGEVISLAENENELLKIPEG